VGSASLTYIERLLSQIEEEYRKQGHGIELRLEEGKAMFQVKKPYIDSVASLAPHQDISRPVLRSLAMIAYNHPLTQAELVKARGNKAYKHVEELVERRLIRAEKEGRTLLLHVTDQFLHYFGLSSVEEFRFHVGDLPPKERESAIEKKTDDGIEQREDVSQEVDDG
jgi:segregation and condensation protein B